MIGPEALTKTVDVRMSEACPGASLAGKLAAIESVAM